MEFKISNKVVHALYGLGVVEDVEEKNILGKTNRYAVISFQSDRLRVMVNLDKENKLIRGLISQDEVPRILDFLKTCKSELPIKFSDRFNINLTKIKSADVYQLVEVIKDLSSLSREKKLTPKELGMLRDTKKMLSSEISFVSAQPQEEMEELIDNYSKVMEN